MAVVYCEGCGKPPTVLVFDRKVPMKDVMRKKTIIRCCGDDKVFTELRPLVK